MPQIPQGNVAAQKDPAHLLNYTFRTINGVYTASSRLAIPEDKVYNMENVNPIGSQNAKVVANISAPLFDFTSDLIYYAVGLNLNNQEYVVCFATNGGVHLFNPVTNTDQVINISDTLSGQDSRVAQWKNTTLLFIDSTGYYSYDGTTFQKIQGPGVPISGDDIAVYAGRVWIAQGRLLINSGADDFSANSFLPANGAAFNNLTDPQIRTKIRRMIVSNQVLYLVAETSVNAVYNVQVQAGAVPPTPTYQNDNVQAVVGSDQPYSVFSYGSNFMMANKYGVYQVYGVSAPKASDDINGTWKHVDFSQPISGGPVVIDGILCAAFLIKRLNDPEFGSNTIMAIFTQRSAPSSIQSGEVVWWFCNFGNISLLAPGVLNGELVLYAFRDNQIFRLYADELTAPDVVVMTKLWAMEDDLASKEIMTVGFSAVVSLVGNSIKLTADTPVESFDADITASLITGSWVNSAGVEGLWVNSVGTTSGWFAPGPSLVYGVAPSAGDKYVGMTLTSSGYGYQLNLMAMDYKLRQRWA
jgi:hypothetical protein